MKRILFATIAAAAFWAVPVRADFAEDARNHGYTSGAYELLCGDKLVLTDAKLRAELDRRYRSTPQFRLTYDQMVERTAIAARKGWTKSTDIACAVAAGRPSSGGPHWLRLAE